MGAYVAVTDGETTEYSYMQGETPAEIIGKLYRVKSIWLFPFPVIIAGIYLTSENDCDTIKMVGCFTQKCDKGLTKNEDIW